MGLSDEIATLGMDNSCIICECMFTEDDIHTGDVEVISTEPPSPFGRLVNGELRLFHKGTAYHGSCYYKRKYRLGN